MDPSRALLHRYLTESSERAFRDLVERHAGLVYQTGLRRAGGDHALARDAAQVVFTDLAQKAGSLPPDTVLAGWLHRHTGFVTSKLIRSEQRRRQREHRAAMETSLSQSDDESLWRRMAPVPDEAVEEVQLMLGGVPAVMKFDPPVLEVKAGARVIFHFRNEKCPLQHNFLMVNPGQLEQLGALADRMLTDPQAMAKHYLPDSPEIHATSSRLIGLGQSDLIAFTAPANPGDYPFLCTFPGHWRLMHGVLKVVPLSVLSFSWTVPPPQTAGA